MEIKVNKTKIIIALSVITLVLIALAILPMLRSSDEGYNTKTTAFVSAKQQKEVIESMDVVSQDVADEKDTEMQAPAVIMEENIVDEETVSEQSAVEPTTEAVTIPTQAEATTTKDNAAIAQTDAVTPTKESNASTSELYSVVDGVKLDEQSYAGFKLFRNWCARCHGTYGQGMVGPNLADSLKIISKQQFYDTVENGKAGRIGNMPSWNANVQVMENMDQIYAYLKARSDGAIGEEKPQKQ